MIPKREYLVWLLVPITPSGQVEAFNEPPSRALIWKRMGFLATNQRAGRDLFSGTLAQKNVLWREFGNYVRQARAYDDAAALAAGTEGGLLQYYAQLNLAKAEILIVSPNQIKGKPIRHGLTYRRSKGESTSGDTLTVTPGVFELLYKKRVGSALAMNTQLPTRRLLAHVPEVGWELSEVEGGECVVASAIHAMLADDHNCWSVLAIDRAEVLMANRLARRHLDTHFEEIESWPDWREVFAITRRHIGTGYFKADRSVH